MRVSRRLLLTVLMVADALAAPPRSAVAQQAESAGEPRSLVVNVIDRHGGLPVRDLTKEEFHLRNNGKPVAVVEARFTAAPRRILVLLDMSASMTQNVGLSTDKWAFVREAVGDLLRRAPADVPIGMLTFSKNSHEIFDFSQSRGAIATWLNEGLGRQPKLKHVEMQTALFDAILEGVKMLEPVQPGDALYAITDGGENASHSTQGRAETALLRSGVRLFTLCISSPYFATVEETGGPDLLLQMVDDTGGFAFGAFANEISENFLDQGNRAKLETYTDELNAQVYGFWTLEVDAPASTKQTKLVLEVVDGSGKARKDVLLAYPRVLMASK